MDIDERLLRVSRIHDAMVEVTTKCNLRCSYCAVSHPDWVERTMEDSQLTNVLNQLADMSPKVISLHGHGETTIVNDWTKYAGMLTSKGIGVSLCSNLMKQFDDHEIDTLSQFEHLAVSIDTIDVDLFKRLRRGGDVRQVTYNLLRIISRAKAKRWPLMVTFSVVVCDKNVFGLVDLAYYAAAIGVHGMTFCNLGVEQTPKNAIEVRHLCQMSREEMTSALSVLYQVQDICDYNKITCDLKHGIIDSINEAMSVRQGRFALTVV